MKLRAVAFNIYLCGLALALLAAAGCLGTQAFESREDKPEHQLTVLRLHIQSSPDRTDRTMEVPVFRASPVLVNINKNPFITEANVTSAEVTDEPGGFSIRVVFDRQGRWLLESYTAKNLKRRMVIFSSFGPEERWLAAPTIEKVIADGVITFTPDATRDEALRIVRGLKNYAKKMEHDPRF
jgi:preprotein translocase subunit SecD